jgi:hypothetical protein
LLAAAVIKTLHVCERLNMIAEPGLRPYSSEIMRLYDFAQMGKTLLLQIWSIIVGNLGISRSPVSYPRDK